MAKIYKEIDFSKYSSVKIGGVEKVEILDENSKFSDISPKFPVQYLKIQPKPLPKNIKNNSFINFLFYQGE